MNPGDHIQYLRPDRAVVALPVHCVDVGAALVPPGKAYPAAPERHPSRYQNVAGEGRVLSEYQIVFIVAGSGTVEWSSGSPQSVGAGTVLLLSPGRWHRYRPDPETGWQEYWLGFTGGAARSLAGLLELEDAGQIRLHPQGRERLEALFRRALAVSVHPRRREQVELAALALQMLAQVADAHSSGQRDTEADQRFERARALMLEQLRGHLAAGDLAATIGCSRSTLHRMFRVRAGMSPYRYYLGLKISAAQWELANTQRAIKYIARDYGFSDQYHFSRVFKEITGVRPTAWRRGKEPA